MAQWNQYLSFSDDEAIDRLDDGSYESWRGSAVQPQPISGYYDDSKPAKTESFPKKNCSDQVPRFVDFLHEFPELPCPLEYFTIYTFYTERKDIANLLIDYVLTCEPQWEVKPNLQNYTLTINAPMTPSHPSPSTSTSLLSPLSPLSLSPLSPLSPLSCQSMTSVKVYFYQIEADMYCFEFIRLSQYANHFATVVSSIVDHMKLNSYLSNVLPAPVLNFHCVRLANQLHQASYDA